MTCGIAESARLEFKIAHDQHLKTMHVALWVNCSFTLLIGRGRDKLWDICVRAMSHSHIVPLHRIRLVINLIPNATLHAGGRSTASQSIGALRALQWSLLDGILDQQRDLSAIEVQLVYDGPRLTSSQMSLIIAKLSPRLSTIVEFCS